jgi:hypothetical protein
VGEEKHNAWKKTQHTNTQKTVEKKMANYLKNRWEKSCQKCAKTCAISVQKPRTHQKSHPQKNPEIEGNPTKPQNRYFSIITPIYVLKII